MKTKHLLTAMCLFLPLSMMAQEDDMYFVPKKKSKQERKVENVKAERPDFVQYDELQADAEPAPDYHVGKLRSDDEYNRRGRYSGQNYGEIHVGNDTVYVVEEESSAPQLSEEDDYNYSGRLVRFYGGFLSPYYWDYYYDWAFYDPWFYNPWFYGYHHGPYGWYAGWYSPWYPGYWYDPWYYPWHHGCWGWVSHHPVSGTEGARYGGRRGINGLSSGRGTRNDLASSSRGNRYDYTRGSMSASRSGRTLSDRNTSSRGTRYANGTSRTSRPADRDLISRSNRSTNTTNRTQRTTTATTRNERTYTPSRSVSSSSSFGGSSSRSSGGGFSGGGFSGGGGRSGGGRGGR